MTWVATWVVLCGPTFSTAIGASGTIVRNTSPSINGDMTGKDFVLLKRGNRVRRAVEAMFLEHGVKPGSIIESSNNMTIYMMAAAGMGLAVVPDSVIRMMNPARIPRVYSIGKGGFHWNIGAIWAGGHGAVRGAYTVNPAFEEPVCVDRRGGRGLS